MNISPLSVHCKFIPQKRPHKQKGGIFHPLKYLLMAELTENCQIANTSFWLNDWIKIKGGIFHPSLCIVKLYQQNSYINKRVEYSTLLDLKFTVYEYDYIKQSKQRAPFYALWQNSR